MDHLRRRRLPCGRRPLSPSSSTTTSAALACILGALLAGTLPALAQSGEGIDSPGWPDSEAGRAAQELFGLINSGTQSEVEAFVRENYDPDAWADFPPTENAAWIVGLKDAMGPLDFHATRRFPDEFDEHTVFAIAYARKVEQWRAMSLTVSPQPPHKVVGMAIMPTRAPAAQTQGPRSKTELVAELSDYLDRMASTDQFSGAVLVAHNGSTIFEKAYGFASRRYSVPNRVDTRFNLGSMNKMVTAVAVLQLEAQGKLSLDDAVEGHLPSGWLPADIARRIQVKHLLNHTSGLGSYFRDPRMWEASRLSFRELEDYKMLFDAVELAFDPGSKWEYSNSGYLILGVLIEKVSGLSYEEYVRRHVYEPAGMKDTAFYEMDVPVPNLATGHFPGTEGPEPGYRENSLLHVVKGGPAGGGYSTVQDLERFAAALRSGALLEASSLNRMWTASALSLDTLPYGLGFSVAGQAGNRRVGHGGDFAGISANLEIHLDTGWTIAILCNQTGVVGAGDLNLKIADWIDQLP